MTCQKCGSPTLIEGVRIIEHVYGAGEVDLSATVYKRPGAMLFKGEVSTPLTGRVCGNCGYVELFVADPQALLAAASDRQPK
jgi:hypothetical protein